MFILVYVLQYYKNSIVAPFEKLNAALYFGAVFSHSSPELDVLDHRLNMELDLHSLFGLHEHSCTHWAETPQLPPSPPHLGSQTRALLVSQERRHIFSLKPPALDKP